MKNGTNVDCNEFTKNIDERFLELYNQAEELVSQAERGDKEKLNVAITLLNEALTLNYKEGDVYLLLGTAFDKLGNDIAAMSNYLKSMANYTKVRFFDLALPKTEVSLDEFMSGVKPPKAENEAGNSDNKNENANANQTPDLEDKNVQSCKL